MGAMRGVVCLFAKSTRRGRAKTRLAAAIGDDHAAGLAEAFLVDSWSLVAAFDRAVLAWDGPLDDAPAAREIWPQSDGDLGARLEAAARRALSIAPAFVVVGSDSPGLPRARIDAALRALEGADADAVLGPADDGGFYLLGLRACPDGLLDALPWSSDATLAATRARFAERGLRTTLLEPWFDVDRVDDLARLRALLSAGAIDAPVTSAELARRWPAIEAAARRV